MGEIKKVTLIQTRKRNLADLAMGGSGGMMGMDWGDGKLQVGFFFARKAMS